MKHLMKRMLPLLLALALLPARAASTAEGPALEIGIWPYMSTQALLTLYHPLQAYLEQRLQRPVLFVTAADQKTFVDRTQKGEYRFIVTAPHFARLAQMEAGYVPMLRAKRNLSGLLLVDKNSAIHSVGDLRGKTVTLPDRITIIAMLSLQALRANGLEPGRDVTVHYAVSHNSAVLAVLRGESAAAATTATVLDQMPDKIKDGVKTLAVTGEVTPVVYLANSKVPSQEAGDMTRIILDFVETPEGVKFINELGYQGLRPPTASEMQSLDPYVAELKKLLKQER
ncbi:MAG: phosphate/phosphite/phosphonate ABC transporter substrate-binding protein [Sulfuricellaceae bacterium]|nr:phosphate/phosphite/phosphonate ABC transporter substrate-binding protein [Sulfuricellaceae bacterium]